MKFEIWIQSVQPDWEELAKLGSVSFKEAIYLSMDISPSWYQEKILNTVENYYDSSEYSRVVTDEEFNGIKEVYKEIEEEYANRIKIAKSWFSQQDWVIGCIVLSPEDIKENSYVDLMKFIKFAFMTMRFENDCDFIPNSMKGRKDFSDAAKISSKILSSMDWQNRAKLYAKEYLKDNQKLSLAQLAKLVSDRFLVENIISAHAGGKEISSSTIKDALSKGGWFTQNQRRIDQ
jgi:hypothetical protein